MNYTLTPKHMERLKEWGFFSTYKPGKLPARGVLITPKDDPEALPLVIDEYGFQHTITNEQARRLTR